MSEDKKREFLEGRLEEKRRLQEAREAHEDELEDEGLDFFFGRSDQYIPDYREGYEGALSGESEQSYSNTSGEECQKVGLERGS